MCSSDRLESVFRQLDYMDDGYEDGTVSHVGLRRIILESPGLEAEIGSVLTRTLLNRAERNLYGRLSMEEFFDTYSEVVRYQMAREMTNDGNIEDDRGVNYGARGTKTQVHDMAVMLAIPASERASRISYLNEYSCIPPPLFLLILSATQIGVFVWQAMLLNNRGTPVGPDGPAYTSGVLIFNPGKKQEVWRFVTYMLVHSGYFHLVFNVLVQLILGIPLEMVHRWWRVLLIYLCGVIAGSLITSITDPNVYLAGASGGVYALIAAHLANVIFNWSEMEFPGLRLAAFLLLTGIDLGVAVYYRYAEVETRTAYAAHLGGAVMGFLLGIVVLRNLRMKRWERVVWWMGLIAVLGAFLVTIVWNAVLVGLY